ncbi:MAG: translation elongation factor Ts, partial [Clostridiaceae bacterium]|nr:translation elongation factor Ts [Clostridiaceae bacterium]
VNSETDFVAKNEEFRQFVKDMAMQVAASNPLYVRREEVDPNIIEKEREIYKAQALNEGKPEKIIEKMVAGRIEKYYKEICLLEQPFIRDTDKTVQDILSALIAKIGENISIRRFVRFERGEGLAKKEDNFVEEVMSQMNKC